MERTRRRYHSGVIRPRTATLTLTLLALTLGCSSKGSAPAPAHGAADAKSEIRTQEVVDEIESSWPAE